MGEKTLNLFTEKQCREQKRCLECGCHVKTQGHRETCSKRRNR